MIRLRRRLLGMRCTEVTEVLQPYIDHEVPPDTARLVTVHLRRCRVCLSEHAVYVDIKDALRRRGEEPVEPEVLHSLRQFCHEVVTGHVDPGPAQG